jgi:hypothetical protein
VPANGHGGDGYGVVFALSPSGTETVLRTFNFNDGSRPYGGLIADSKGNVYGTTSSGGAAPGDGAVLKLTGTGFAP